MKLRSRRTFIDLPRFEGGEDLAGVAWPFLTGVVVVVVVVDSFGGPPPFCACSTAAVAFGVSFGGLFFLVSASTADISCFGKFR